MDKYIIETGKVVGAFKIPNKIEAAIGRDNAYELYEFLKEHLPQDGYVLLLKAFPVNTEHEFKLVRGIEYNKEEYINEWLS